MPYELLNQPERPEKMSYSTLFLLLPTERQLDDLIHGSRWAADGGVSRSLPLAELLVSPVLFSDVLKFSLVAVLVLLILGAFFTLATNRRHVETRRRSWASLLVFVGFFGVVAILGATSFGSILQSEVMSGYALLAHVTAAGAFTFLLVAVSAMFLPRYSQLEEAFRFEHRWWLARWSAWLLMLSSLIVAGTMFLSMLPVLDTNGLRQVLEVHRYAGLATVISAVLTAAAIVCTRFGWR